MRGVLLLVAIGQLLSAAVPTAWEMNTYKDFLAGRFEDISLDREGSLRLAPAMEPVFSTEQPVVWSVAEANGETLYLGTGHGGRLYRVGRGGEGELLWTADEPEIFAVAVDPRGRVYAATSPNGKVYRIEDSLATEYFDPGATYIWALAFDSRGTLYVGAGGNGTVYRVTAAGQGEVYYETGQLHVTCLAFDSSGRLLAGTEPNGILYRISEKDRAFVLYDSDLPEIRAVIPGGNGEVYAAALGGSVARRAGVASAMPFTGLAAPIASTSVTVTAAQGGVEIEPQPSTQAGTLTPTTTPPGIGPALFEVAGVDKSALYRIHPDNTVETLWTSAEENAYDVLAWDGNLLLSTDRDGRIYELAPDRKLTLLAQTGESEAIRLLRPGRRLLVATGDTGRIYRMADTYATEGSYEAPIHDAGSVARWGQLSWRQEVASGCRIALETRSGNTARPDRTWSDWSEPLTDAEGSRITSPNARYVQWRAVFTGTENRSASLAGVRLAYLRQNNPPRLLSINVSSQSVPNTRTNSAVQATGPTAAYSITVTDTGEEGASSITGTSTQRLTRSGAEQIQVTWQAEDYDGDRLVYELDFRGEGETRWKNIETEIEQPAYVLESTTLADGRYLFRVHASDRLANPPDTARNAELISAPVLVDQTPPVVTPGSPRRSGDAVEIEVEVADAASELTQFEYSLNAEQWVPVASEDGIIDARSERFHVRVDRLPPGEHVLVFRAFDAAENAGLAKVVLR